jgi:tRNA 2-selenouridine synthase
LQPCLKLGSAMVKQINIERFFDLTETIPVIDVRSPKEFEHAHIPGAINLPLFSNEERARVGICYKNEGRQAAVLLGLEIAGPKLAYFALKAQELSVNNQLVIHCWRGGMRSSSMAWLFGTLGIKTFVLEGGYKAYRRFIKNRFAEKANFIVLGGLTGSGKTEILKELAKMGQQVIDLEDLANHKGSAFGALGQNAQTSTEQFENNLYEIWKTLDLNRPIWIEDESKTIGKIGVPDELYWKIRNATVIAVDLPVNERLSYLLREYGDFSANELKESLTKIKKRLGGKDFTIAVEAIANDNIESAAVIALNYYDKAYRYGLSKRNTEKVHHIELNSIDHKRNASEVLKLLEKISS